MWSSRTPAASPPNGAGSSEPETSRGRLELGVELRVRVRLARELQVAVADQVEQDHRLDLVQRGEPWPPSPRTPTYCRLPRRPSARSRALAARLLGVEQREVDRAARQRRLRREHAGQLEHDGNARRAVVRALESGADVVLGVVVGTDQDDVPARAPGSSRRRSATGAGSERPRRPPPAAAPRSAAPSRSPAADPAGRGPIATCASRSRNARSASNRPGAGGPAIVLAAAHGERQERRR